VPAIQPALLRQQAILLAEHFSEPAAFIRSLHYLLDFYSDRSRHHGVSGTPPPITSAYKVRPPVIKMILQELAPLAAEEPAKALELCDALWNEPVLEFRQLGAMLLGQVSPEPPEKTITRLKSWLTPDLEFYLVGTLMEYSFTAVRKQHPQTLIRLIQQWLEQKNKFENQMGLRALLPLISQPDFQNLPVFYRLIQPFMTSIPSGLRPDVLDVLEALAKRSPQETAFFLKQSLSMPESNDAAWITRQLLPSFSPEIQKTLRQAVREASERKRIA
jgi:DNA alkylation repair enzyme